MNKRSFILNTKYSALQAVYFMFFGAIYSFASAFLLGKNINNSHIGIIFALANILGALLISCISALADRKNINQTLKLGALTAFIMLLMTALLLYSSLTPLAISVLFILIIAIQTSLQPIVNVLGFKLSDDNVHVSFGLARSMGSFGYSVFCIIMGIIVDSYGIVSIPISGVIILVLIIAAFLSLIQKTPDLKEIKIDENSKEQSSNFFTFALSNKSFLLICIGILGVFFSNGIFNSFLLQIVNNVGGTGRDLGAIYAFMAFLEIPTMLFFDKISKFFSYENMLKLSALCFSFKMGICMMAKNVFFLYVAHFLQPIAFALFLPAMVHYIDCVMNEKDAVKGQGLFTSFVTVSYVLASVVGGFLLDNFGVFSMNSVATVLSFLGSIIIIFALNKRA